MSARKRKENEPTQSAKPCGAAEHNSAITIGISGRAPGVKRTEVRHWARQILRHLCSPPAELSIALVKDATIRVLNHRYRGKDEPTDVLSFPLADALQPFLLGEVIISIETAARQAERRGRPLREELQVLLIHGILHLLGYDHEVSRREAIRMQRKEREVRAALTHRL